MGQKKISVIVLIIAGLVLLMLTFIPGYLKIEELTRENRELEKQIAEIRQTNRKLQQEQLRLQNDPLYVEQVARRKLGLVREGEVVYQVVPTPQGE